MEKSTFATSGSEQALGELRSLEIAYKVQNIDEIQTYDLSGTVAQMQSHMHDTCIKSPHS